ncbi:hypothetical protein TSAR_006290, partial [Trichomalopsis sarcophagae]
SEKRKIRRSNSHKRADPRQGFQAHRLPAIQLNTRRPNIAGGLTAKSGLGSVRIGVLNFCSFSYIYILNFSSKFPSRSFYSSISAGQKVKHTHIA